MNSLIVRTCVAIALVAACGRSALAQDVTVSFKGTITTADQSPFADVGVGTPFKGFYTYNLSAPDNTGIPGLADYLFTAPPYGLTIIVGTHTVKTNPSFVNLSIEIRNDFATEDGFFVSGGK